MNPHIYEYYLLQGKSIEFKLFGTVINEGEIEQLFFFFI